MQARLQTPEEIVAIRALSNEQGSSSSQQWLFESCATLPDLAMGRTFGGSSIALGVHAAYHTLPKEATGLRLYSVMGNFLGPGQADKIARIRVTNIRSTRTFATRQIIISQTSTKDECIWQDNFVMLIDFVAQKGKDEQEKRERNIVSYSVQPPLTQIAHHSELCDVKEHMKKEIDSGKTAQQAYDAMEACFNLLDGWDNRYCPEGMFAQHTFATQVDRTSNQANRPIHERRTWDWARFRKPMPIQEFPTSDGILLPPTAIACSAILLCHYLDTWTSVIVPWLAEIDWSEMESYSTLDFAIRFHVDDLDATQWHLRESKSTTANNQRNYVEEQLWQEKPGQDFTLVATVTESCILRGVRQRKEKGKL
ncbi:uncharacterized protein FA14DRAFT_88271 [Meira miltonrushii]|uniref:Thioesterase/thiol ester dehydrase-isomerase n=1 Tax=Meira miltonrushii TaxID=1280837 RepID=A0A316V1V2_9BASI|nr:uncharacterized protein FA14DRAFT_88271 [Meira miltonrushii]PWN31527.1 hypothetical protein FA14DRAFT_88271 [Meira miltonrushii]